MKYTNFFKILDSWNGEKIKVLDIGAGPGTMCFAFIEYLEYINQLNTYDFEYSIKILEREENFINFLNRLENNIKILDEEISTICTIEKPIISTSIDFNNVEGSLNSILGENNYNVIILSFILNENDPQKEKNKKLFRILSNHLKNKGIIIFIGAASDYLFEYFEINFEAEAGLVRIAPCLNGNRIYGNIYPFFCPCGDLCTFQMEEGDIHKFCYLILSKTDFLKTNFDDKLQKSIEFFNKFKYMLNMNKPQRVKKLEELGDIFTDFFGLYSNKRNFNYYFCNGICKFKINSFPHNIPRLKGGDVVVLKNIKFDGEYKKPYTFKTFFWKNYAEIAFKYLKDISQTEIIDNLHNDI